MLSENPRYVLALESLSTLQVGVSIASRWLEALSQKNLSLKHAHFCHASPRQTKNALSAGTEDLPLSTATNKPTEDGEPKVASAVNQVELHPHPAQNDLRKYCLERGITVEAYMPSGYSTVRNDLLLVELAKKYNATPNQVILAWHLGRDTVIIPKSAQDARQKENINLPTLHQDDILKISSLDRGQRIGNKPDAKGMVWGWTAERMGW